MDLKEQLLKKIKNSKEIIGVVGLGYVGMPLAKSFEQSGLKVLGFDKNPRRGATDFIGIKYCDAIFICVPTPLDKYRKPDMSYIEKACTDIGRNMKQGTFISLESTTYPTTTEDVVMPILERESGLKHGKDFWLAYSPERVDPGNKKYHTCNTPKILGALTKDGLEIGEKIYSKAIDQIHVVSSARVAEMAKILENTYRLINISMVNEMALLCGKMDINIWEVIDAAKTKPFGFQAFYPSPGIGGHCISLDSFYLEHIAKKFNFDLSMIHTAGHINMRMPHYMYIKIVSALNEHKKSINGSKVLFLGVSYKPNIDDVRESPALKIMDEIEKKGGKVYYHDPFVPTVLTDEGISYQSMEYLPGLLNEMDCVVISTNHDVFEADFIVENSKLVVDLRNVIKESSEKVYKL